MRHKKPGASRTEEDGEGPLGGGSVARGVGPVQDLGLPVVEQAGVERGAPFDQRGGLLGGRWEHLVLVVVAQAGQVGGRGADGPQGGCGPLLLLALVLVPRLPPPLLLAGLTEVAELALVAVP